jgi:hypothetical protein
LGLEKEELKTEKGAGKEVEKGRERNYSGLKI